MHTGCQEKRPKNQREQTDGWAPLFMPLRLYPKNLATGEKVGVLSLTIPNQDLRAMWSSQEESNQEDKHTPVWPGFSTGHLAAVSPVLEYTSGSLLYVYSP